MAEVANLIINYWKMPPIADKNKIEKLMTTRLLETENHTISTA